MESPLQSIARIIRDNDDFLVCSHLTPDGDAMGATAAVGFLLQSLGKRFLLYNVSGLPERFFWMSLPGPIVQELPETLPVWTIALDSGTEKRLGSDLVLRYDRSRTLVIDHHIDNTQFGAVNWVDTAEPAVGSMVARLARELDVPLAGGLAEAIYLAVTTDTGFFTYGNTTPAVLDLTAELMRGGLDFERLNDCIRNDWTPGRAHLFARAMHSLDIYFGGLMAIAVITAKDFLETGTTREDCEGIINFVRRLKGVRVSALLREEGRNNWKFSLRSQGDDNVQTIAAFFGGGGHKNASGGHVSAPLDEAKAHLVKVAETLLGAGQ